MKRRIKLKGKKYLCIECGYKTPGHMAVINHLEKHHMKEMLGFKCPKCYLMCDTFLTFNEHMKIAHKEKLTLRTKDLEEEKLLKKNSFSFINDCIELLQEASDKPFDWQRTVKQMLAKGARGDLICSVCRFSARDSLKGQKAMISHIETEHMRSLLGYRCPDCGELLQFFVAFNQHMNISHNVHINVLQNGLLVPK